MVVVEDQSIVIVIGDSKEHPPSRSGALALECCSHSITLAAFESDGSCAAKKDPLVATVQRWEVPQPVMRAP